MRLNATLKGLITGAVMVVLCLIFTFTNSLDSAWMFVTYFIYAAGVMWSLVAFSMGSGNDGKFKNYFAEGFKAFIIVTLMMVIFWWIYYKLNPQVIDQMIQAGKEQMLKEHNLTPAEIDNKAIEVKKEALTMITSASVVKYLILGVIITVIGTVLLQQQQRKLKTN